MDKNFLPPCPVALPIIYAYAENNPDYEGLLRVGYTTRTIEERMAEHYPTKRPDGMMPYRVEFAAPAMYSDGGNFLDHDVHRTLTRRKVPCVGGDWFRCSVDELKAAYIAVRDRKDNDRPHNFSMRPEQEDAVLKTAAHYESVAKEKGIRARFLWNAKMRFGKTFAAYQLAKFMDFSRVLILTFKPAVQDAWEEDLKTHIDFDGWQFISRNSNLKWETADKSRPIVCFGSFQDYLGVDRSSGIVKPKPHHKWVHEEEWDLVIFDEYHFGAWRDKAQKLFEPEEKDEDTPDDPFEEEKLADYKKLADNDVYTDDEDFLRIKTSHYLYLSGTPFRAIKEGEFGDEQIYCWTYSDEQWAKAQWSEKFPDKPNPYAALPRMVMKVYKIPDSIRQIAMKDECEFDLNEFFSAKGEGNEAKFKHENHVQKWLNLIRGESINEDSGNLKIAENMPYFDNRLLATLTHTLWFLPNVASCDAMGNLLKQPNNTFFHDYIIKVCAGSKAGIGLAALAPIQNAMGDPLKTKTITLTCGKLTTGVTVKPWTGIFILRNSSSPETYFQSAFRVQSPWEVTTDTGKREIVKHECYVFDFALDRALKQIYDYSCQLTIEGDNQKKVEEFLKFLPVIAYEDGGMVEINADAILQHAMSGMTEKLLIRCWKNPRLVNVDNVTLSKLMKNDAAMKILMSIEQFRKLTLKDKKDFNVDDAINTIISKSEEVKKAKTSGEDLSQKEKREITEKEKEYKKKREEIRERLIWFLNRVPIFMYLSEYREVQLSDVITQTEPEIFKRVSGISVEDFKLLLSLDVFNNLRVNDAIGHFKRYEDSSLSYTGIINDYEHVGGFDTVITSEEYKRLYGSQQVSMGQ